MIAKEKAIPDDYGVENGKNGEIDGVTNFPQGDYIIDVSAFQVASLLKRGPGNAVSAAYLAAICDVTPRHLQKMIEEERKDGAPILSVSSRSGYYLPSENPDQAKREIAAFVRVNVRRAKTLYAITAPARKTLKKWDDA